jgi:type VI secretion system protein VasI
MLLVSLGLALIWLTETEQDLHKEIAKCAAIQSDLLRLTCFDQIAASPATIEDVAKSSAATGSWRVETTKDPLTDSRIVLLALVSDGNNAMLMLRCNGKDLDAYINWNEYLGSEAVVTSRIGTAAAEQLQWGLSTDKKATFYPRNSKELVQSLKKVDKFIAQVTPYNESPVTAVFNVTGLSTTGTPLMEACALK